MPREEFDNDQKKTNYGQIKTHFLEKFPGYHISGFFACCNHLIYGYLCFMEHLDAHVRISAY